MLALLLGLGLSIYSYLSFRYFIVTVNKRLSRALQIPLTVTVIDKSARDGREWRVAVWMVCMGGRVKTKSEA
jgi:hypothetical protein